MEELKEIITTAVEQGVKNALANMNIGSATINGKDPNELLTVEQVHEEFNIGINKVREMFKDPELGAQKYTRPFKVLRKSVNNYITVNRDYLKEQINPERR